MQCSAQIVNETDWILDSTAEFTRAEKNLWFLRLSLGDTNQGFALEQMATDGAFGLCYDEWFKKLDAMVAALNRFSESSTPPKYTHLAILRRISTPEMLISYLDGLLISDIAKTGVNFRDELNATASMVAEVLYKERLRNYVSDFVVHRPLTAYAEVFNAFVEMWQDPETGYWGAWFQSDGKLRKSLDLSMTYHIVAYRRGEVRHWDRIFDTTLAIADQEYPYGWLQNGTLTNHHAYDVARILKLGWNHVSEERRQRAGPALERLLAFGLTSGLNTDDSVTPRGRPLRRHRRCVLLRGLAPDHDRLLLDRARVLDRRQLARGRRALLLRPRPAHRGTAGAHPDHRSRAGADAPGRAELRAGGIGPAG